MSLERREDDRQSAATAAKGEAAGAARNGAGDKRRPAGGGAGTGGAVSGASGWRPTGEDLRVLAYGWVTFASIVVSVNIINVVTIVHERPGLDIREPIVWEGSSALITFIIALMPWAFVRWVFRRGPALWLIALAALIAAPLYSLVHTFGFLVLRIVAYDLAGETYRYGSLARAVPYEMTKDVLAFAGATLIFWQISHLRRGIRTPAAAASATFDIRDGGKVIRVAVTDILAVTSAGNYVEFLLADGRKPLMRSALSAVEGELGPQGFVRTHRSWLVNAARVTGLTPEGSGDYAVEVGLAVTAPLSRRFPDALAALRKG